MAKISKAELKLSVATAIKNIDKAIEVVKTNRLFIPGWMMRDIMSYQPRTITKLVLAKVNNNPVAVGIRRNVGKYDNIDTMLFVRKDFRRQGIGTSIINKLKSSNSFKVGDGVKGSKSFFKKVCKTPKFVS